MRHQININDDILVKYLCGEASPEEAIFVEQWKKESPENLEYFVQMHKTYGLLYDSTPIQPNKEIAWKKLEKKTQTKSINWKILVSLAAIFIVGVLIALNIINFAESNEIFAYHEQKSTILKDKSEVIVLPDSKLVLTEGFGKTNRTVSLKGKANFRIEHEGAHPFIVKADDVFIEDIGTAFTVENLPESDTVYVVVNEGIVRLYDAHGNELIIRAGEKAWYIKSEKRIITDINTKVIKFDFKETKLEDVARLLEENYNIEIDLVPEKIGNCTITTQFFDEEVATIINVIAQSTGFNYQYQHNRYIIEGKPCQ